MRNSLTIFRFAIVAGWALVACCAPDRAFAQTFPGVLQPGQVLGNNGTTPAPAAAIYQLGQRSITGTYTVGSAGNDSNSLLVASGGFYNIALGAASGYAPNYVVWITNADPWTGASAAAKTLSGVTCPTNLGSKCYLWPGQTVGLVDTGNAWTIFHWPGRAELPNGTFTINVDPVNGTDSNGASDGLATGGRAFKSFDNALTLAAEVFELNSWLNTSGVLVLKCTYTTGGVAGSCAGQSDSQSIHWAQRTDIPGATGRAAIIINCNGAALSGNPSYAGFFSGSVIEPQNCNFVNGVSLSEGAKIEDVNGNGNTYGNATGGVYIDISGAGSLFWIQGASTLAAGSPSYIWFVAGGGRYENDGTQTCAGTISVANQVAFVQNGSALIGATSSCGVVTGTKYSVSQNGVIDGSNVPGSAAGSTATGGQDGSPMPASQGGTGTTSLPTGAVKANGTQVTGQAACGDLSNAVASCSTDATNASNIIAGTLSNARLANTWTAYSPTIGCGSGSITTLGTVTGSYYDVGAVRHVEIVINITTNGSCAGAVTATLPSVPASGNFILYGAETNSTGYMLIGRQTAGASFIIVTFGNAYPGGSGYKFVLDGWYRTN
jgi:hypothetical protein